MQKKIFDLLKLLIKINCMISFFSSIDASIDIIAIDLILNFDDNQDEFFKKCLPC